MILNILLQAQTFVSSNWWYYLFFMPIIIFKFVFFSFFLKLGIIKGALIIITLLAILFILQKALSLVIVIALILVEVNNNATRKIEEIVKTKVPLPDDTKEKFPVNSALNLKE